MKIIRCRICGETYLGTEAPSRCPFCGAASELLVGPDGYDPSENNVEITEVERADLLAAIELERANARFYVAVSRMSGDSALASTYKRLSRVEAEHCSVFCKLARVSKPEDLGEPTDAPIDWCHAIEESAERERMARQQYLDSSARATNDRIREVFDAVANVELDHIEVDRIAADRADCV